MGVNIIKQDTTANRWCVPVLVERELARHVRFGIGPAVSIVSGGRASFEQRYTLFNSSSFITLPAGRAALFGIGAALEFPVRLGPIIVAPEIRYTRWTGKHYGGIWALDEVTAGVAIRR